MRDSPDARRAGITPTRCAFLAALALAIPSPAFARQFQQPFLYADRTKQGNYTFSGDVNGDGKMDLLQNASGTMTVMLGDGNTNFTFAQNLTFSQDAALGDVNGDGKPDLVTTTLVKLNNGDGTFGPEHPMLGSGSLVHLQDLNADGKLDLVAVTQFDIRVTAGNGDGTFAAFTYPFPIPSNAVNLTLADVNGDGKADALVGTPGKVSVLLGTGSSATWFQPRIDTNTGGNPYGIAVGDLNEDGKVDLAVASTSDPTVGFIHLGNGDGTFAAASTVSAPNTQFVVTADFNQDGHVDVMFTGASTVRFFAGIGNGTFAAPTIWDLAGSGPFQLVHADNGATWDVLWGNGLLLGNGNGTFGSVRRAAAGAGAVRAAVGDINGDGFLDVAVVNTTAATVTVALGNGDGTLGASSSYPTDTNPVAIAVKDVNGDGRADVLTANQTPGSVSVLLALPGGALGPKSDIPITNPYPRDLKVEDLNGDGKPELVVARAASVNNTGVFTVFLGVGNGTFTLYSDFAGNGAVLEIELADMDGDGKLDAVLGCRNGSGLGQQANLSVLHGDGTGAFVSRYSYSFLQAGAGLGIGDFNQDGKPDVVHGFLFIGNGDCTFSVSTLGPASGELAVADFDRDGKLDIAANGNYVVYGDGTGAFPRFEYLGAGTGSVGVEVAQMNPGTDPDLVVTNGGSVPAGSIPNVTVLLNNGLGSQVGTPPVRPIAAVSIHGYPNPALSVYQVSLEMPRSAPVVVSILDASGRRVRTIESGTLPVGVHRTSWDLIDRDGRRVSAGMYFCEVRVADQMTRTRFAVLR